MSRSGRLALVALIMLGSGRAPGESGNGGPAEGVARWFSPGFRDDEARLAQLETELASLPSLLAQPFASRYGFRSETLVGQDEPQWLQIDLGRRQLIDRVVAMPVHIPVLGKEGEGYGFPLRFKIEVADNPEMHHATPIVDRTAEDVANPGRYPMDFRIEPIMGRYLRFTSTRHFPVDDGFLWALEELIVLSGNNSVATDKDATASSHLELYPNWSVSRIKNGQSALGLPVTTEPSPSRGYLSALTTNGNERKWLRVDLGREYPINEVRLVPVESGDFETLGERAFPRGSVVELATDPEFEEVVWSNRMARTNLVGFPGGCAIILSVPEKHGRYLRLVTSALWGVGNQCGYGLAEIQAYANNENVALGKPVVASDRAEADPASGWAPAFATDGFGSLYRLVELPKYLDLIGRRGQLEKKRVLLVERQEGRLRATSLTLSYGGGGLGGVALLGWGWVTVRQRKLRRKAVARLREQIARDLHDDIGTNLGGIVLVSEVGGHHSDDPRAKEDFQTIKEAAEQTSQSMQDIVWLIERGNTRLRDLVSRMRQATELILGDKKVSLIVEPPNFRDRRLSLFFRRHFFFAFKEALHNIRRHAAADAIEIRITLNGRDLGFEVRDNGSGFDQENLSREGHGLANLRRRSERLDGTCNVESHPGEGTLVTFQARIHLRK